MNLFLLYLFVGVIFGVMEIISVMFIRDGCPLWLKFVYGLICALIWPVMFLFIFIPDKVLNKLESGVIKWLK